MARQVKPSDRGELEIASLLGNVSEARSADRRAAWAGYAWLDTGTHASLLDASNFVRTLTVRQGLQTGSPDEIAFGRGWISRSDLAAAAKRYGKNDYGLYLEQLLDD